MTDAEKAAFEWLVKQHKKANAAMRRAETKQNNDHEKRGLKRKIDILQWLIYRLQLGAGHTPHARWFGWHGDKRCKDGQYRHFHYYECSECGRRNAIQTQYCPHCGAKMDAGEDNT